ncbi:MAG: cystathionine synthase [Oscillospiraceae bacterium]|nr:cystathionine synthase [Oscillospiraceae bacterium]
MDISTVCIHGGYQPDWAGSVTPPVYLSSTFAHPGIGSSTGYDYSRLQNPTREYLEKTVCALEEGHDAMAFSSGMAAIACVLELFRPGDHIITSADLYGGSIRLFHTISEKNGLTFTALDTGDLPAVQAAIRPETKAIFVETPSNPTMQITDLRALSELARQRGLVTIVDNTFLTPYFQKPILLGADLVVHSGTKYLSGHNDVLAGFVISARADDSERLRFLFKTIGSCLSAFDSWMVLRGIKTLPLRMERHGTSAAALADWLTGHPKVKRVYYPGVAGSAGYQTSLAQTSGFGGMISFETDTEETAHAILERVKLILFAESLGGAETLITYPILQTHADVPREECLAKGINERLLRLSVGLEGVDDIISDLKQALDD